VRPCRRVDQPACARSRPRSTTPFVAARKRRELGPLNPVPYPTQAANSISWIAYAYGTSAEASASRSCRLHPDAHPSTLYSSRTVIVPTNKSGSALLFWCNEIGFLMGIFFTLSLYGLARTKTRDRILAQVMFYALVLPLIGAIGVLTEMSDSRLKLMWGFTANGILLLYYAAPLSTVVSVIKTKSATSINLPLACMQCLNGALWLGYGLAVSDLFIWIPNAIGTCTGAVLLLLLFAFREDRGRRRREQPGVGKGEVEGAGVEEGEVEEVGGARPVKDEL